MRKVIQESIETWKSSSREIKQSGEHRSLKYYVKNGYDKNRIRRHCKDKKYNPLTGWTYSIFIDSLADIKSEGSSHSDKTLAAQLPQKAVVTARARRKNVFTNARQAPQL